MNFATEPLARLHEWMEEYEDAYKTLSSGESLYSGDWEFASDRAAFALRSGDLESALRYARRATELAPWRKPGWFILAATFEKLGQAPECAAAAERVQEIVRVRRETAAELDLAKG